MNRESFIITMSLEEKTIIVITKLAIAPLPLSLFRIYYSIYHQIYECYIIYEYVGILISNMNVNSYSLSTIFHKQKNRWHSLIPKIILSKRFELKTIVIHESHYPSTQYTLRIISVSQCHIRMSCVLRIEFRNNMENHTYSAVSAGRLW